MLKTFGMYVACGLLTLTISVINSWIAQLIFVRIYACQMGVPLNTLSEDYNMGFRAVITGCAIFIATLLFGGMLAHQVLSSKK